MEGTRPCARRKQTARISRARRRRRSEKARPPPASFTLRIPFARTVPAFYVSRGVRRKPEDEWLVRSGLFVWIYCACIIIFFFLQPLKREKQWRGWVLVWMDGLQELIWKIIKSIRRVKKRYRRKVKGERKRKKKTRKKIPYTHTHNRFRR